MLRILITVAEVDAVLGLLAIRPKQGKLLGPIPFAKWNFEPERHRFIRNCQLLVAGSYTVRFEQRAMVRAMKALLNWPRWHHHVCSRAVMIRFLHSPLPFSPASFCRRPPFSSTPLASRHLSSGAGAIRLRDVPVPPESSESGSEFDTPLKKSRNEKKREAQRCVRWGMELAKFQPPQIKRILR